MKTFQLNLFGGWQLIGMDQPQSLHHGFKSVEARFSSRKEQALVAYVATQSHLSHSRSSLMALLWPDSPFSTVQNNLRVALYRIRKALDQTEETHPLLHITRQQIRFNHEHHGCDVLHFRQLYRMIQEHQHGAEGLCPQCAEWAAELTKIYQGEFLEGFYLDDAPDFDQWLLVNREHFHLQILETLFRLAEYAQFCGDLPQAAAYAQRQIAADPLTERAYQQLMRIQMAQGERAQAIQTYERCAQNLLAGLGVLPSRETTELYESIDRGQRPRAPARVIPQPSPDPAPAYRAQNRRHNLPAATTPLIGREVEIERVTQRLLAADYRLLTLTGPGGVGKSRLALAIAQHIHQTVPGDRFRDGLFFVSLAPLQQAEEIPLAILSAMGIPPRPQAASLDGQLVELLADRHLLLILDNLEHLLEAVPLLLQILTEAPNVSLLVTSRLSLGVQAEDLFVVAGLPLRGDGAGPGKDQGATMTQEQARSSPAVRLFVDRAYRINKAFHPFQEDGGGEWSAVVELCRTLEGMPLGIELAATWIGEFTPGEIQQALHQSLDFLAADLRDLPPRQRSLRAVFEYSWQLLTPEQQAVLARISIFQGSFTDHAAQAVTDASPAVLAHLVRHHLLQHDTADRYVMHELLRMFARQKLALYGGATQRVARQHSQWYLHYAGNQLNGLRGPECGRISDEIYAELDNIRLAWQTAVKNRELKYLFHALPALFQFMHQRGFYEELVNLTHSALQQLSTEENAGEESAGGEDSENHSGGNGDTLALQVRLLLYQSRGLDFLGNLEMARQSSAEALALARTQQDPVSIGEALLIQANMHATDGELTTTLAMIDQARAWIPADQAPHLLTESLLLSGVLRSFASRHHEAEHDLARAEENLAAHPNLPLLGRLRVCQGINKCGTEEFQAALYYLQETERIALETRNRYLESRGVNGTGFVLAQLGDYAGAKEYHTRSLAIAQQMGEVVQISHALHNLCVDYYYLGDLEAARQVGEEALRMTEEKGLDDSLYYAQTHLGHALIELGRAREAEPMFAHAYQGLRILQRDALALENKAGMAWARYAQGNLEGALALAQEMAPHLNEDSLMGSDEPARVFYHLYEILRAGDDPLAPAVLQAGRRRLERLLSTIDDPAIRERVITQNPFNRRLMGG